MVSITTRVLLLFITVLLATEFANCDDSSEEKAALKETYVGTLEKSIRALIRPKEILQRRVAAIRSDLKQLASDLFLPINTERIVEKKSRISDILNPYKSKIKAVFPGTYHPIFVYFFLNVKINEIKFRNILVRRGRHISEWT